MEAYNMLNVYLSGEIHSNWREEIIKLCEDEGLDILFTSTVSIHVALDDCGIDILVPEEYYYWNDMKKNVYDV